MTNTGDWARWEDLYERVTHIAGLAETLPDFVRNPVSSAWLYKEIAREAAALEAMARAYVEQVEKASEYERQGPTPQDPDAWKAETPLVEKAKPDAFRPVPKPRDPRTYRRGGDPQA